MKFLNNSTFSSRFQLTMVNFLFTTNQIDFNNYIILIWVNAIFCSDLLGWYLYKYIILKKKIH